VKYVSKSALWQAQFGEDYVHWELVNGLGTRNILGGVMEWLALLRFCRWEEMSKIESTMQASHPLLFGLRANLKDCSLDTGGEEPWTLVCRVFLLTMVQGLPSLHALEVLTCDVFKRDTHGGCMQLLAKQAEQLYAPAAYEEAIKLLLDRCTVETRALEQTLQMCRAAREERTLNLKMSRMTVMEGRPRLRDRVSSVLKTEERKAQVRACCSLPVFACRRPDTRRVCARWMSCSTRGRATSASATGTSSRTPSRSASRHGSTSLPRRCAGIGPSTSRASCRREDRCWTRSRRIP